MATGVSELAQSAGINVTQQQAYSYMTYIVVFIGMIVVVGLLCLGAYLLIRWFKYNQKIVLYRKVGNETVPVALYKAMYQNISSAGDQWLILARIKKILARPRIQMAKRVWWYYEREDGEWINFGLSDIDAKMKKADIFFIDEDMRFARTGIQKNLNERLNEMTFLQKWGGMIMYAIFIVVVLMAFILSAREFTKMMATASGPIADIAKNQALASEDMRKTLEIVNQILIKSGCYGGIVPAT
jgi:hypothetical protein